MTRCTALAATAAAMAAPGTTTAAHADGFVAWINEIRIDQPGPDVDEYVELHGVAGASLDNLTYIVLGDGAGADGTIEVAVNLSGHVLNGDGYFLLADNPTVLGATADMVASLNFENSDNVTHALIRGFTGAVGDDLDLDDDGRLDVGPWDDVLDTIALVEDLADPPVGTEWWYGDETAGPDGEVVPSHIYRCTPDGEWAIGVPETSGDTALDSPGGPNAACEDDAPRCAGDINGDMQIDEDDLVAVILGWGSPADPSDVDGSGMVNVDDLIAVILAWGTCS